MDGDGVTELPPDIPIQMPTETPEDPLVAANQDLQKSCFGALLRFFTFVGVFSILVIILIKIP